MKHLIALIAILSITAGCAKKVNKVAETPSVPEAPPVIDVPAGPYTPPGTGPGSGPGNFNGLTFEEGGTAELKISGSSLSQKNILMSEYTGRSMNLKHDGTDKISINVNLVKIGEDNWKGTVTTSYIENGNTYYWYFSTGDTESATRYNKWFVKDGKTVFHAVLEDFQYGSIVLVIDDVLDLGDGEIEDSVSGSLWFKNFGTADVICPGWPCAPHPPTHCWFVSFKGLDTGTPYDCRPWPTDDGYNDTYMSVEPARQSSNPRVGYKKLGTFQGLRLTEAFNGEYEF